MPIPGIDIPYRTSKSLSKNETYNKWMSQFKNPYENEMNQLGEMNQRAEEEARKRAEEEQRAAEARQAEWDKAVGGGSQIGSAPDANNQNAGSMVRQNGNNGNVEPKTPVQQNVVVEPQNLQGTSANNGGGVAAAQTWVDQNSGPGMRASWSGNIGDFGKAGESLDNMIAVEEGRRERLAKELAEDQEQYQEILNSGKTTQELIQELNAKGWPFTDIYKLVYGEQKPEPELDERQQRRANFMAGLSDAMASIIEGASAAAGATIQRREPHSSAATTSAQIDAAKERDFRRLQLYNQGLLQAQNADITEAQKLDQQLVAAQAAKLKAVMDGKTEEVKNVERMIRDLKLKKADLERAEANAKVSITKGGTSGGGRSGKGGRSSSSSSSGGGNGSSVTIVYKTGNGQTQTKEIKKSQMDKYRPILISALSDILNGTRSTPVQKNKTMEYLDAVGGSYESSGGVYAVKIPPEAYVESRPIPPYCTDALKSAIKTYLGLDYGGQMTGVSMR